MKVGGLQRHRAGMVLGTFFALLHLLWSAVVYLGLAAETLDFVFRTHYFLVQHATFKPSAYWVVTGVVTAFASGYIVGTVIAFLWNKSYSYF